MIKLTVICPGIRPQNWIRLYNAIGTSFSGSWEIIFIGPYGLPVELEAKDNVMFIESQRSPIACQQIGLIESRGEFISWASDDGVYLPMILDKAVELLEPEPYTTIVTSKYFEGGDPNGEMGGEGYYRLWNHDSMQLPGVPKDCYMLNCGVVSRSLLVQLGGWDSYLFGVCPLAYTDFAIRAHKFGCKFILQEEVMFSCGHMPGTTGDHASVHYQQTDIDQPLFTGMYSTPGIYLTRQNIPLSNWKRSQEVWLQRFGDK